MNLDESLMQAWYGRPDTLPTSTFPPTLTPPPPPCSKPPNYISTFRVSWMLLLLLMQGLRSVVWVLFRYTVMMKTKANLVCAPAPAWLMLGYACSQQCLPRTPLCTWTLSMVCIVQSNHQLAHPAYGVGVARLMICCCWFLYRQAEA